MPKRTTTTLATLLAAVTLSAGLAAQEIKLVVFDPQRVSEETAIGKQVQMQLSSLRDRKQAEISAQEGEIGELRRKLQEQELSLSPDRRSTMERDIQSKLLQLQSAREVASRELQLEVAAAQNSFEEKLLLAVQAYGKEQGLTVVLARDLVAWADDAIDATDPIIARFDKMFPATGAVTPTP